MAPTASSRSPHRSDTGRLSPEEKLVAALIAQLEAGTTPWRREWDERTGGHHVNLFSGRRYSGANPVLLTLGMHVRGSALPYWCGYVEARARGLAPRRGSRAVHIFRPQLIRLDDSSAGSSDSAQQAVQQADGDVSAPSFQRVSFRPLALFNAADLEGEALAGLIRERQQAAVGLLRPEPERLARAEAVLTGWPVPVRFGGDRACYIPARDRIQLPERNAFHHAAALYATWAHEAIHSTGHPTRLARDLSGGCGSDGDGGRAYAREELVAELGAVLLGDRLAIGSAMDNHAAYLSGWIALLRETPRALLQVLADARRAADLIQPEPAG